MELGSKEEVSALSPAERLKHYKQYLSRAREEAYALHQSGAKGRAVCTLMAERMDALLQHLFSLAEQKGEGMEKLALVANGGYGRGRLYPGSDLDLLFLTPRSSGSLSKGVKAGIDEILYPLWDLNLKVGHAVRSTSENIQEAKKEPLSRTTLLDSRLITGNEKLFSSFKKRFRREAIINDKANFFQERSADLEARYKKYSNTIFLQEPNVKESPGGLRDWHNLLWLMDTALESRDISEVCGEGVISEQTAEEIKNAVDFLMRLRNEMHFHTGKATDILSLRLQGEIAQTMHYEGGDILIKIENLMRDYYTNARTLHNRVKGIFELLNIEMEAFSEPSFTSWIPWVKSKEGEKKRFEGFYAQDGLLYAEHEGIFTEDSGRILRCFWLSQKHGYALSPSLRKLIKGQHKLINTPFRTSPENRETLESIFSLRGRVGLTLRRMHRVGVLGLVFPEFGALDCLVQHEFFHRYTADEHTLRCIEMVDQLTLGGEEGEKLYAELFQRMEDPVALYLALLLHDTGRALNTDNHVDGSNFLADRALKRLGITGERRKLIMFLVDHHLTFFQTGTKKDIDDPEVIQEFCSMMKTSDRLEALLVFTYCDSLGTNPDGWNGWKELAITTLYKRAAKHIKRSPQELKDYVLELLIEQKGNVRALLDAHHLSTLETHYEEMPISYFRYRGYKSIARHIKAVWQYENRRMRRPHTPFEAAVQWIEHEKRGYTEVCVVTEDKRNLLASICCAMATHQINILSANVHTRSDGLVLDLFRVCDSREEALTDDLLQMEVVTTLYELNKGEHYDPSKYLVEKKGFFYEEPAIVRPPFVGVSNEVEELYTTVEVHTSDRIGLLHDLLKLFAEQRLMTIGARIMTEHNTAVDTFLVLTEEGKKLSAQEMKSLYENILEMEKG